MSNLTELEKQYEKLGEEIKKLKDNKYVLGLFIGTDKELIIGFSENYDDSLGDIDKEGDCCILDVNIRHNNWELWKEHGTKVSQKPVKWKSDLGTKKEYNLTSTGVLKAICSYGNIYDFIDCKPVDSCFDDNINRFSNGTPKLF